MYQFATYINVLKRMYCTCSINTEPQCFFNYEIDAYLNTCKKGYTFYRANPEDFSLMYCRTKNRKAIEQVGMKEVIIKALTTDAICIYMKEIDEQKAFCSYCSV